MDKNVVSRIVRNVSGASGARLLSLFFSFMSVPLLLHVLGKESYGVWAALTSILLWIPLFDFGVGSALRNTVAGMGVLKSREEVGAEFFGLMKFSFVVFFALLVIFLLVGRALPLFDTHWLAACLLYSIYILSYPLTTGTSVLQGLGRVALSSALQIASTGTFFLFLLMCWLVGWLPGLSVLVTVFALCCAFNALVIVVLALARLDELRWGWRDWWRAPIPFSRISVGLNFLFLQACGLLLYYLGNVIIFGALGGEAAARYDLISKIFQVALSFYYILVNSVWAEASRLIALQRLQEVQKMHSQLLRITWGCIAALLAASLAAPTLIGLWTNKLVAVSVLESLSVAAMVSAQMLAYAGTVFLNAFERVGLQVVLMAVSAVLMLPLSYFLVGWGWGIAAIPLAAAMLTLIPSVVANISVKRVVRRESLRVRDIPAAG